MAVKARRYPPRILTVRSKKKDDGSIFSIYRLMFCYCFEGRCCSEYRVDCLLIGRNEPGFDDGGDEDLDIASTYMPSRKGESKNLAKKTYSGS